MKAMRTLCNTTSGLTQAGLAASTVNAPASLTATATSRVLVSLAALLLMLLAATAPTAQAQQPRFLSLMPPEGLPIIPVFEGWVAHADGSRGYSFGVINRNEVGVDIPLGAGNTITPGRYDGSQPTHFPPGRSTGFFYLVVSPADAELDVWWELQTGTQEALKVPGRSRESAYELDFVRPRPQGALQPLASFGEFEVSHATSGTDDTDETGDTGSTGEAGEADGLKAGLLASIKDYPEPVAVGEEIVLAVTALDPSDRDPSDPRFGEPLDLGVEFNKYQGPGAVSFRRDPNAPEPENPYNESDPRFSRWTPPEANEAVLDGGRGYRVCSRDLRGGWRVPDSRQDRQLHRPGQFQRRPVLLD